MQLVVLPKEPPSCFSSGKAWGRVASEDEPSPTEKGGVDLRRSHPPAWNTRTKNLWARILDKLATFPRSSSFYRTLLCPLFFYFFLSALGAARSSILALTCWSRAENDPLMCDGWCVIAAHLVLYGSDRVVSFRVVKQELQPERRGT